MRSTPWRWIDRLDRAELVDAPLDDLDRLLDRLADALDDRRLGRRQPDQRRRRHRRRRRVRWPVAPSRPPSGCDSSRSLASASCRIDAFAHADLDRLAADRRRSRAAEPVLAHARGARRRAAARPSPCAPRWNRPRAGCASRPAGRGRARCGAAPSSATSAPSSRGKKFGTAKKQTSNAVSRIAAAFQREKYSMSLTGLCRSPMAISSTRPRPSPARPWRARPPPSGASAAPARRRRSRPRSGRRRPPW